VATSGSATASARTSALVRTPWHWHTTFALAASTPFSPPANCSVDGKRVPLIGVVLRSRGRVAIVGDRGAALAGSSTAQSPGV
jgi:hypothetical protein